MSGPRPHFQPQPLPRPRSQSSHDLCKDFSRNDWRKEKQKLVNLFRESCQVDQRHIAMAQTCIEHSQGDRWYQYVPFNSILEQNRVKEKPGQLMMMASVFDYLLTYIFNLLKPNRHPLWRSIRTNKPTFRTKVDCMEGARDILKEMGYSVETDTSLEFPMLELEPSQPKLCVLAAELLMCKMAVKKADLNSQMVSHNHRLAGANVEHNIRKVSPRRSEYDDAMFFDAVDKIPEPHRLPSSPRSSPYEPEFFDALDRMPSSNNQARSGGGRHLTDTVARHNLGRGSGVSSTSDTTISLSSSERPVAFSENRLPLRAVDNASPRILRAGWGDDESAVQRRTDNTSRMSQDDGLNHSPCVVRRTRSLHHPNHAKGFHSSLSSENMRPPTGTPALNADIRTGNSRFPTDSWGHPGKNQTTSLECVGPLTGNIDNPSLSTGTNPPVASVRHAEKTDSHLCEVQRPVPKPRHHRNQPYTSVHVSSASLASSSNSVPHTPPSLAEVCPTHSTSAHKSLHLQETMGSSGTTSDSLDTCHDSSVATPSSSPLDLELAPGTSTCPNPTLDNLRKGLENLRNRNRVVMNRAETSESVLYRPSLSRRGEHISQRKTQTESIAIKAGVENTVSSISSCLSETPALELPSSPSLFSSIKVPPKAKSHQVTFGNDLILEELEEVKEKSTTGQRDLCRETKKTSSGLIHEQHSDQHIALAIMPADVPLKPPPSSSGPRPNVRPLTMLANREYFCQNCNRAVLKGNNFCGICGTPIPDDSNSRHLGSHGKTSDPPPGFVTPTSGNIEIMTSPVIRESSKETEKVEKRHCSREQQIMVDEKREKMEQSEAKQKEDKKVEDGGMRRRGGKGREGGMDEERKIPGDEDSKPDGRDSKTVLLREKEQERERRFCEFQRSKGRKESEIESLPSNHDNFKSSTDPRMYSPAKKSCQHDRVGEQKQLQSIVAKNKYEKEDMVSQKMARLGGDGQRLLNCFKECMPHGFTLEEIQLACHSSQDQQVHHYLNTTWATKVRDVRHLVSDCLNEAGRRVGLTTEKKARQVLVEMGGDVESAVKFILQEREENITQLLNKMNHLKELEPQLPELDWDMAVEALSKNGMDVNATFYILQTDWLQPLYQFIFSEFTGVAKTDMENIKEMIKSGNDDQFPLEARIRLLMAEFKFGTSEQAKIVLGLIENVEVEGANYPLNYYVDAARDFDNIEAALEFLNKECPTCSGLYPIHEMITFPSCTDFMCKECFRQCFSIIIKEKEVKHFNCPSCKMPDMANRETTNDLYLMILVSMIKENLGSEHYQLMEKKLTEFNLMRQPGFVWCANCPSGFIFDVGAPRVPRMIKCPNCEKNMCHKCKKPWEVQHDAVSCEDFAQWKQDNDPDVQKQGLAAHLNANGIECPQCHMRYDLARGGCLHFRCTRCPNEFCSGCGQSFKNGVQCGKFQSCKTKGLHAHHPRDCLFYLRDFDVESLQKFLQENDINFDVNPPREQVEAARKKEKKGVAAEEGGMAEGEGGVVADTVAEPEAGGAAGADNDEEVVLRCRVMLQKDTPEGLCDEECGREVIVGHAGLCSVHYMEYLVDKINKNHLDPVTIYPIKKVELMLIREEMELPERNDDAEEEDEEDYNERLIQYVKQGLPLIK